MIADLFLQARMMGMILGINMISHEVLHITLAQNNRQVQRMVSMTALSQTQADILNIEFATMAKELKDAA